MPAAQVSGSNLLMKKGYNIAHLHLVLCGKPKT